MNSLPPMPQTAAFFLKSGTQFKQEGKLDDAIAAYNKALEINSNLPWTYHNLGEVQSQLGDYEEAVAAYQQALKLNPNLIWSYEKLGEVLTKLGRLDEAISLYSKAIEINSNFFNVYKNLGDIFQAQGKQLEALNCYCRAIELNPNSELVHGSLWMVLTKIKHWDTAVASYRCALKVDPNSTLVYQHLGHCLISLQRWDEAIACLRRGQELNPQSVHLLLLLGSVLAIQGKLDEAIAIYQQILSDRLLNADICCYLANCLVRQGRINEAIATYERAVQVNPDCVEAYCNLGWLLSQQNQWNEAIEYWKKTGELTKEEAVECFQKTSKYTFIKLHSLTQDNKTFLKTSGISLANLELIARDNTPWLENWPKILNYSPKNPLSKLGIPDFMRRAVETGYLDSVCPMSGKNLKSNQSFYISHSSTLFYRFEGHECFYLIVGTWATFKLGIYFPNRELLIGFMDDCEPTMCDFLKSLTIVYLKNVQSYLSHENKTNVSLVGTTNNIGHYFWNEVSAIQELYQSKNIHRIDHFLILEYNYLHIDTIFPEIHAENPNTTFLKIHKNQLFDMWEFCLNNNFFLVKLTAVYIQEKLASRIYHNCYKICDPFFLQKVAESKKHFPLIWITLRSHRRAWVSQVEGIANLIKELFNDFPNLGIIFDGLISEKANMDKILQRISPEIITYSALDCAVYETVVWVDSIDLAITSFGAGSIFPSIANKTCIYHSHQDQLYSFSNPFYSTPRENSRPSIAMSGNAVVDVFDEAHSSPHTRNYDVDWKAIYNQVVKIIEKLNEERRVTS